MLINLSNYLLFSKSNNTLVPTQVLCISLDVPILRFNILLRLMYNIIVCPIYRLTNSALFFFIPLVRLDMYMYNALFRLRIVLVNQL